MFLCSWPVLYGRWARHPYSWARAPPEVEAAACLVSLSTSLPRVRDVTACPAESRPGPRSSYHPALAVRAFLPSADVRISSLRRGAQVALTHPPGGLTHRAGRRQPAQLGHVPKPRLQLPRCELSLSPRLGQPQPDTVVPPQLADSSACSGESQGIVAARPILLPLQPPLPPESASQAVRMSSSQPH